MNKIVWRGTECIPVQWLWLGIRSLHRHPAAVTAQAVNQSLSALLIDASIRISVVTTAPADPALMGGDGGDLRSARQKARCLKNRRHEAGR